MLTDAILEQRLTGLETAIEAIQKRLASYPIPQASDWVERFTGSFKNEPAFAEVVAHGQAMREADRSQSDEGDNS